MASLTSERPGSLRNREPFREVTAEHLGAVQFEIKTRGHSSISDQPLENGAFDEGVTPPERLLASLGSCAGYHAAQYLRKHKLAAEGTRVRVSCDLVKTPVARLTNFVVESRRADRAHR